MKKAKYEITISATAQLVYNTMLGLDNINTYEQWTAEFNPSSTYEGSWEVGSKMYFIGISKEGKREGMIAEIVQNIPNEFVSIRHYGLLIADTETLTGPEVEKWAGSLENYTFKTVAEQTTVSIEVDVTEEYLDYFNETWVKALEKLKTICQAA